MNALRQLRLRGHHGYSPTSILNIGPLKTSTAPVNPIKESTNPAINPRQMHRFSQIFLTEGSPCLKGVTISFIPARPRLASHGALNVLQHTVSCCTTAWTLSRGSGCTA